MKSEEFNHRSRSFTELLIRKSSFLRVTPCTPWFFIPLSGKKTAVHHSWRTAWNYFLHIIFNLFF